ncbi:HmuY family protein [Marinifilum breve]|nr:HmuY family protein [Marinifilum breve]
MNKISLLALGLLFSTSFLFTSCSDDDNIVPVEAKEVIIDASDYTKWVYFSFEEGKIVGESAANETRDALDWDIAFHRYNFRTNSGTSGSGQGGLLESTENTGQIGWDNVVEAPETGYKVDEDITIMQVFEMPPTPTTYVTTGGSTVMTGGTEVGLTVSFDMSTRQYSVNDQIYVIKTADGKYAKLWVSDFYDADSKSGHVTLKYSYQEDGSRSLR